MLALSEEERKYLESIAKNWGVSMSAAIRRLIRERVADAANV